MKCLSVDYMGRTREVSLENALRPTSYHEGGQVESAQAQADANAAAIGRLLALLVEYKFCDLSTAAQIAGNHGLEPL